MSASRRQAPLSTVSAANANSISALAKQASSRLDETRFAPLRRARERSARSKHARSARAPTRFALEMISCKVSPAEQGAVHLDPAQIQAREISPGLRATGPIYR